MLERWKVMIGIGMTKYITQHVAFFLQRVLHHVVLCVSMAIAKTKKWSHAHRSGVGNARLLWRALIVLHLNVVCCYFHLQKDVLLLFGKRVTFLSEGILDKKKAISIKSFYQPIYNIILLTPRKMIDCHKPTIRNKIE